ncbi:MAG: cytidylate kinase-like family protein [Lachnospiraceae bacterium]|nr:cytidylate kinase-like family protein [Lachnospiraceae bacterium]
MNRKIVIAISREYGSGGKIIGEMLSEDLGIHYYDKELMKLASEESGINEALFNKADAKFTGYSLLNRITRSVYKGELLSPRDSDFTSKENLFNYQAKVIRNLADADSCIIVGRCADFVLKDYDNVVRVFLHAPESFRLSQAAERVSLPPEKLQRYVEKENAARAEYYRYYTGNDWYDVRHVDLSFDTSVYGFDKCAEFIKGYMKLRFEGLEF